jgi:hypothetical protein
VELPNPFANIRITPFLIFHVLSRKKHTHERAEQFRNCFGKTVQTKRILCRVAGQLSALPRQSGQRDSAGPRIRARRQAPAKMFSSRVSRREIKPRPRQNFLHYHQRQT